MSNKVKITGNNNWSSQSSVNGKNNAEIQGDDNVNEQNDSARNPDRKSKEKESFNWSKGNFILNLIKAIKDSWFVTYIIKLIG